MNNVDNMWDFPVMEGIDFENVNRIHPLMQGRVEKRMDYETAAMIWHTEKQKGVR